MKSIVKGMYRRVKFRSLLAFILIILLNACSTATPPLEFAPDGEIIQKAIALGLEQTEKHLSQKLNTSRPEFEIGQINVKKIEPVVVGNLPTYHLQGTYDLKLTLPRQKVTQPKNRFDLFLQRQVEGKTWRLLKRETRQNSTEIQWSSYLIR
jgi:hypothetical protein